MFKKVGAALDWVHTRLANFVCRFLGEEKSLRKIEASGKESARTALRLSLGTDSLVVSSRDPGSPKRRVVETYYMPAGVAKVAIAAWQDRYKHLKEDES